MAANSRWQKAINRDKFVAAFCRNLTLVRMRLVSLAEIVKGMVFQKLPAERGRQPREIRLDAMLADAPLLTPGPCA